MKARRTLRVLVRLLLALVAVLVIAAVAGLVVLHAPLPDRSGRQTLPGLSAPARVLFDRRGIPHVRAATEEDACRVLGWLHAGDRFFQMELRRRVASGRLAEAFGASLLPLDLEARRAGYARAGARDLAQLSARTRGDLEAYAEGVSAYIATHPRPLELLMTGIHPSPWTAADSLAFARFMIAGLSEAPDRKIRSLVERGILKSADGTGVFSAADAPAHGSNAWALAGTRTASGKPLLANDPHLGVEFPGVWYAAHLTTEDGLDIAGLTLPGVPGVAIGHTHTLAWGITMAQTDDADVFLETLDAQRHAYQRDGRWVPLEAREERIKIQGQPDRQVVYYATDRGTLLGGLESAGAPTGAVLAFAPERTPSGVEAFVSVGRARSAAELDAAWSAYGGAAFNVCWASEDGHVGVRLAGAIPLRRSAGRDELGFAIEDWAGLVPDAELQRILDPAEGFVASANDDASAAGKKLPFPGFYATNDRIGRIRELLAAASQATVAGMSAIQNDVLSPYALRVVKKIGGVPASGKARRALQVLEAWDGKAERTGPSRLFYAFLSDFAERKKTFTWSATEASLDDPASIAASLAAAIERVEREDGTDPERWSFGRVHVLRYEHPFSSRLPFAWPRRWLDVGPIELPGDTHTINVEAFRLGREPRVTHIPSARLVVDLGDLDASTLVLPLGQSGQFLDPHYSDQVEAWANGRAFPLPFTRQAVDAAAVSELVLQP